MVCKHCGHQLSIEDETCPFCGMPNEASEKHIQEMQYFSGQFHKVQKEALEETGKVRSYMPFLIMLGILAAANVLVLVLLQDVYRLEDRLERFQVRLREGSYYEELTELEAEGDYVELGFLYIGKNLYQSNRLREFAAVADAGETYGKLIEALGVIAAWQKGVAEEEELENVLRSFGDNLQRIYEMADGEYYRYVERSNGGSHGEALQNIREETETLLSVICGCSEEELVAMRTMKSSELTALLRRKLQEKLEGI